MRKIGIIAAVLALSVGTWFFMQKTQEKPANSQTALESAPAKPETPADPSANPAQESSAPEAAPVTVTTPEIPQDSEAPAVAGEIPAIAPSDAKHGEATSPAGNKVTSVPAVPSARVAEKPSQTSSAVAPATGAPTKPSTPVTSAPLSAKQEPAKNCLTFEYRHQESAKSKDIESFLDFSNAFPIAAENVNKKSICVKVNQKPVEFQILKLKGKEEIVIGPVVGPESIIRVSYCTGAAQCRESCIPQKKRFMDDLLSDAHADEFQDSWGKAGADTNSQELKAKTKELQTLAKINGVLNDRAMMRDWNTLQKQEWTCNQK
ncbi:MAG: hypothetical protein KGP28_09780 [Bdellovibrionales bacterium]|nr:hypothetical protein [Bdellovibrionales bacterium]